MIAINNSIQQTLIFCIVFFAVLFLFISTKKSEELFPNSVTKELKGLAIFGVIFCHIGYFLVTDPRFLYPLSTIAGISVDLFLFLSGLGLTLSTLKKSQSVKNFYTSHLSKLFTPFWIVLIGFLSLDFLVLHIHYPWQDILKAFFGIFTRADIYKDFDSPLWYFTFILFYYLLFPLVFNKKYPWLSALIIYTASYFILTLNLSWIQNVSYFYSLHIVAFPLGICAAWLLQMKTDALLKIKSKFQSGIFHYSLITFLLLGIGYLSYHSGTGTVNTQQWVSICAVLAIILLFLIKNIECKLLYIFGIYSYEIYLFHWPLMYRYDFLYHHLPASLATILYLALFIPLAWLLQKISHYIDKVVFKM
jgi:peptidoglycan/LPS O-acetylase OafA/YrhL